MKRFDSPEPLRIPMVEDGGPGEYSRADLIFYGVDHSGPSYEGRIFLNHTEADVETPRELEHGYAGSFMVFGHAGCVGEEGHCDVEDREVDEFDFRGAHPLEPWTKAVEITSALRRFESAGELVVTVLAVTPGGRAGALTDALDFERVRLALYAD
jgi:hypothetical protein